MATSVPIPERPRLYTDSDDRMVQRRVEVLDGEIYSRPELYMIAATTVGHLSLGQLVNAVPAKGLIESQNEIRAPKERLRLLLQNRDAKFFLFDPGSDDAIYADSHTKEVLDDMHQPRQRVTVSGDNHVYRATTDPEELRDHLDMHKVFLYAQRVRAWKTQQSAKPQAASKRKIPKHRPRSTRPAVPHIG